MANNIKYVQLSSVTEQYTLLMPGELYSLCLLICGFDADSDFLQVN